MKVLKITLLFLTAAFFIAACNETPTVNKPANTAPAVNEPVSALPTPVADELASAAKIYSEKCVRCHKEDGSGGEVEIEGTKIKAEDFTSDKMKKMDDAKYVKYINEGVKDEGMPAFKGKLTDDEIDDVVKYIRREFQK